MVLLLVVLRALEGTQDLRGALGVRGPDRVRFDVFQGSLERDYRFDGEAGGEPADAEARGDKCSLLLKSV